MDRIVDRQQCFAATVRSFFIGSSTGFQTDCLWTCFLLMYIMQIAQSSLS